MYMIRPMPKAILIHSVQYKEYVGEDRYGNSFKEPITLKNVLIQPVSAITRGNIGENIIFNSLMFYDCTNSMPENITLS